MELAILHSFSTHGFAFYLFHWDFIDGKTSKHLARYGHRFLVFICVQLLQTCSQSLCYIKNCISLFCVVKGTQWHGANSYGPWCTYLLSVLTSSLSIKFEIYLPEASEIKDGSKIPAFSRGWLHGSKAGPLFRCSLWYCSNKCKDIFIIKLSHCWFFFPLRMHV